MGAGALNIDPDMVAELTKAFQEPSTTTKVTDAASAYKVPAELYTSLFKTPKVEKEMVKQVGNIHHLAINPDLRRALEVSFESSVATWWLGWRMMVMINYLYNHYQADPVLNAVCNHLHGAIRESCQTSAQATSVTIAAQRCMILAASAFRDCRPLRATLMSTPFVGSSLFGGQFQSSFEEATCSQEKLTQVRRLAPAGSRAAQGTSGPRASLQSQKHRAVPPPHPPPTAQSVPSGDGGSVAKNENKNSLKTGETTEVLEGHGDCRSVTGPGWILFPLLPGYQVHWWVPPHPQPTWTQLIYTSCQVPHGNPHLYSAWSSQRLVDGVAGSQGRLSACANTPQSLAVSSVCFQEPDRGAHCLSMESSPFWLSYCPQSFYQTLGSSSSTPAFAGMFDVSVH